MKSTGAKAAAIAAVLVAASLHMALYAQTANDIYAPDADDTVRAIAVQPDGRIVIGGSFSQIGLAQRNNIARLHPDGSPDTECLTLEASR